MPPGGSVSKSHPIPLKGREYDTLTGWRRVLAYVQRPGVRKYDKRAYNKRVRRWKDNDE